jgi:hypothetical protein
MVACGGTERERVATRMGSRQGEAKRERGSEHGVLAGGRRRGCVDGSWVLDDLGILVDLATSHRLFFSTSPLCPAFWKF